MNFAETEFDGLLIEDYRSREHSIGAHALDFWISSTEMFIKVLGNIITERIEWTNNNEFKHS